MIYTRSINFSTRDGIKYAGAVLEVSLDRLTAVARVFKDETRSVALRPTSPLRIELRSADHEADPVSVMQFVVDCCLADLADGDFVESPQSDRIRWSRATFDVPKVARWAGWTNLARRIINTNVERLQRDAL